MAIRIITRVMLIGALAVAVAGGDSLPVKDSSASFGSNYGLGFSDGVLYLHTGDSIYTVDISDQTDPKFSIHMSGLESAFADGQRAFEGGFVTGPGQTAAVSMGFTDGGVLMIDLNAKTTAIVPDFDGDSSDDDNIFGLAVSPVSGAFYAVWASRSFYPVDATKVYKITPGTLVTELVENLGHGHNSGDLAFDASGNLFVSSFEPTGIFPDPTGSARLWGVAAADVDDPNPNALLLASDQANGSVFLKVDQHGNVVLNTTTGIGALISGSTTFQNIYGDILDLNLYGPPSTAQLPDAILEGLAYDLARDQIVFTQLVDPQTDRFELMFMGIPEPATAIMVIFGLAIGFTCRQRREDSRE